MHHRKKGMKQNALIADLGIVRQILTSALLSPLFISPLTTLDECIIYRIINRGDKEQNRLILVISGLGKGRQKYQMFKARQGQMKPCLKKKESKWKRKDNQIHVYSFPSSTEELLLHYSCIPPHSVVGPGSGSPLAVALFPFSYAWATQDSIHAHGCCCPLSVIHSAQEKTVSLLSQNPSNTHFSLV